MRRYARICAAGLPAEIFVDLVGKPFRDGARGPNEYDCLGAAMEIARRRGFYIPDFESTQEELHRQLGPGVLGPCRQIERAAPGAVVLMRSPEHQDERHIGTMVDHRRMIHASKQAGQVVLENLWQSFWGRRVLGYYQLEVRP